MVSHFTNLSLLALVAGVSALASAEPVQAANCSVTLSNAVGDRISVSALLDTTDADEIEEGEDESLTVASSGGELSGNLAIYELWYPFKSFKAKQANETIQGTIANEDDDETCTISASTQANFSYDIQNEFESVNESIRRVSLVYATALHICDAGRGNPTICAQHFHGASLIMDLAAFLAGMVAKTANGTDFTEVALPPALLDIDLEYAGHEPDALGDAFFALKDNSKKILSLEVALATTAGRANGAAAKHGDHWARVQRGVLAQYRKELGQALLDQASLSQALSQAITDAAADLNILPSDVEATRLTFKSLKQKEIAHLEKLGCDPNDIPFVSRALVMQDSDTFSGTLAGFLTDSAYLQSLQTLGQRLLS